jgi:hypothetical protein
MSIALRSPGSEGAPSGNRPQTPWERLARRHYVADTTAPVAAEGEDRAEGDGTGVVNEAAIPDPPHNGLGSIPDPRPANQEPGRLGLRGVLGGSGDVGAAGRGAPDQDAWFRLFQPPPFGLLTPMMMSAEETMAARADTGSEPGKQSTVNDCSGE